MREEFSTHATKESLREFTPQPLTAQNFSRLARELETKRQIGALTVPEKKWLAAIDQILESIAKFNRGLLGRRQAVRERASLVYDLKGKTVPEPEPKPDLYNIALSAKNAAEIIDSINQQFEEKVMSKVDRDRRMPRVSPASSANDFGGAVSAPGRSLSDYLSAVKEIEPKAPFLDSDSHFDLSKFAGNARPG